MIKKMIKITMPNSITTMMMIIVITIVAYSCQFVKATALFEKCSSPNSDCRYGCCGECKSAYCCTTTTESYFYQLNITLCDSLTNNNNNNSASTTIPGWLISLVCIMAFMLLICVCKILIEAKLMRRSAMMRRVHSVSNESGGGGRHRNHQHAPQVDGPDGVYTSRIPSYSTLPGKQPITSNELFQQETAPPPYYTLVLPKHNESSDA